jgi:hypothetical protein
LCALPRLHGRLAGMELPPEKTQVLSGGPLDGHQVTIPGYTIALIVFHNGAFHRYNLKAKAVGHDSPATDLEAPLVYDGPVSPETAGFT